MKTRAFVVATATLMVLAPVAHAGATATVEMTATTIEFTGPVGIAVRVRVSEDPSDPTLVTFSSNVGMSTDAPECGGPVTDTTITCVDNLTRSLLVDTQGGSDSIEALGERSLHVAAHEGADVIVSDLGADAIAAGAGDDGVSSGGAADVVTGGDGDDSLFGQSGQDTLRGGDGFDALAGGSGGDGLYGGPGADRITGGGSDDNVYGGPGDDWIDVRDGIEDVVNCGKGNDVVIADAKDDMTGGCNVVRRG